MLHSRCVMLRAPLPNVSMRHAIIYPLKSNHHRDAWPLAAMAFMMTVVAAAMTKPRRPCTKLVKAALADGTCGVGLEGLHRTGRSRWVCQGSVGRSPKLGADILPSMTFPRPPENNRRTPLFPTVNVVSIRDSRIANMGWTQTRRNTGSRPSFKLLPVRSEQPTLSNIAANLMLGADILPKQIDDFPRGRQKTTVELPLFPTINVVSIRDSRIANMGWTQTRCVIVLFTKAAFRLPADWVGTQAVYCHGRLFLVEIQEADLLSHCSPSDPNNLHLSNMAANLMNDDGHYQNAMMVVVSRSCSAFCQRWKRSFSRLEAQKGSNLWRRHRARRSDTSLGHNPRTSPRCGCKNDGQGRRYPTDHHHHEIGSDRSLIFRATLPRIRTHTFSQTIPHGAYNHLRHRGSSDRTLILTAAAVGCLLPFSHQTSSSNRTRFPIISNPITPNHASCRSTTMPNPDTILVLPRASCTSDNSRIAP